MPRPIQAGHRPVSRRGARALLGAAVLGLSGLATVAAAQDMANGPRPACASSQHWNADMAMCMAGAEAVGPALMLHVNQFALASSTSGPRGLSRVTGPGTWMVMFEAPLSPHNTFHIDVMGSPEQLTVGETGTPQLLQTEHIDSMHAHDTIMELAFSDVLSFGDGSRPQQLTLLFAPRGEASIGPVPFMHRSSAEGNPDAPLGHALQDGFHDASTVLGLEYRNAGTALEMTAFSGQGVSWPLPLHRPDSYGLRINQAVGEHVTLGASYAHVLVADDVSGTRHTRFAAAWLAASTSVRGNPLTASLIWGRTWTAQEAALNSMLGEAVYRIRRDKVFGRAELLALTPDQLALSPAGGSAKPRWVAAFTAGYERTLVETGRFSLFAGGSYTMDALPAAFRPAYGSAPRGGKAYLRLTFDASWPGAATR